MISEKNNESIEEVKRSFKRARPFEEYLNGISLAVVGFLILFIFMAYMTRITVGADFSWLDVGIQTAILYTCTVSINLILRSYGKRKGRHTKEWEDARLTVEENNRRMVNEGYTRHISTYCRKWEDEDLLDTQKHILADVGLTVEEFKTYAPYSVKELRKRIPTLTEVQLKAIGRARRKRRLHYHESYLSVNTREEWHRTAPSGGITAKTIGRLQTLRTLFTSAITSVFAVAIVCELIADPSFATVVTCLIKVVLTLVFGVIGLHSGYTLSYEKEVAELKSKADEQVRFMKWCESENPAQNSAGDKNIIE